jgi:hypothetical protein
LDTKGKLRQNDWGLLEMKICAAYLRKFPLIDLDILSTAPRLFNIALDEDLNIGYELYLLKPKLACVITKNYSPNETDLAALNKKGVNVEMLSSLGNVDELFTYGKLQTRNGVKHQVSHQYLIVEKGLIPESQVKSNQLFFEMTIDEIHKLLVEKDIERHILDWLTSNDRREVVCLLDEHRISGTRVLNNPTIKTLAGKVVLHRHGDKQFEGLDLKNYPDKLFYYEPYSTQTATGRLLSQNPSLADNQASVILDEFNLAAKLKVGMLDERIQSEACKEEGKKRIILNGMKVFIPDEKTINLNSNSFRGGIATQITDWIKIQKYNCDYIIIHQGIIEKTIGSTDVKMIEAFINNFYTSEIKNKIKAELIIISGRGKPSNLPKGIFYLPYSLINQYINTYLSKIYLYKLLKSARRYHG